MAKQTDRPPPRAVPERRGARIVVGRDIEIPVPDVPPEEAQVGDAESAAVAAHQAFQALLEQGRRDSAAGKGIPAEEFYREFGLAPPATEALAEQAEGDRRYSGRLLVRVPKSVHRELAERAEAEGVSVNQLILTYISRGLGAAEADAAG